MARPNNSTLLLPLMAVIALIYPFAFGPKQSLPSGGSVVQHVASSSRRDAHADHPNEEKKQPEHNAETILTEFFGDTPIDPNNQMESPIRGSYRLDLMVFTVPDPVDSRLPYLFDRNLTAIQRAAEANSYVLDSFDLPWREEMLARAAAGSRSESAAALGTAHDHHHEYEFQPGYLLFSRPKSVDPAGNASALLVFLVGETPTAGIHKSAMVNALDEISWLCGGAVNAAEPPAVADEVKHRPPKNIPTPGDCRSVKILGPSFSGSAQSLDFALHSWMESRPLLPHPRFRIVSGSATAIPTCSKIFEFSSDPDAAKDWKVSAEENHPVFSATVVRDKTALNFMLQFLNGARRDTSEPLSVALLTEGSTTYGASLRLKTSAYSRNSCKEPDSPVVTPVDLPFPLHISRLRSESERARKQHESAQQDPQDLNSSLSLPLPTEDDTGDAKDSVPPVSQLDISASELMLSNLLSTISREQFQYVGIAATDVRDVIFLAREIRQHSPATVIFALNADLLYSHPEAYTDTRGMLVATPYPLFALNQSWMKPATPSFGGTRFQFPDQGTEGIYNAALELLQTGEPLLEYASPFALPYRRVSLGPGKADVTVLGRSVPPLWIVAVGRDGFWPVAVSATETEDASWSSYTLPALPLALPANQNTNPPTLEKRSNRGIVPQFTHAVLILWGFLCVVPAMMFLSRLPEKAPQWRLLTRFSHWMVKSFQLHRLFRLTTIDAKCFFLIGGTASLSIYAIAITAYSISAIAPAKPLRWFFLLLMILIVALGLAACAQLTADIVKDIRRKRLKGAFGIQHFNSRWFGIPILIGVASCWLFTVLLIAEWFLLGSRHPGQDVITGFRAVNLQNGVSPLVPLFCVGLAAILWVYCSLRRLCFLREVFSDDPWAAHQGDSPQSGSGAAPCETPFFFSDSPPFQGLLTLEKGLREMLECPTLLSVPDSRVAMGVTMALALFWGGYLFFTRLVFAFEVRAFYWLLGVTFLLVVAGILSNVLRLYLLWRGILAILRRLGRLPMRDAFTRFRQHNRSLPRMTLATAPEPLTSLGVSIVAARDLIDSAREYHRLRATKNAPVEAIESETDFAEANKTYQQALACEASSDREDCRGKQTHAQCNLNSFTRKVEKLLESSWDLPPASTDGAEKPAEKPPEKLDEPPKDLKERKEQEQQVHQDLVEQAEEFLVSRTVHFLAHMFPQLTNLASYSMGCLFLMLMAISSYPLQPKNPFAYFCWFVIFAFLAVVLRMAVQMNRDAVLSCLNGTKPGEIHWDAGFVGRILVTIVVPVLGLLGVQFPGAISEILRWVAPGGSGHP